MSASSIAGNDFNLNISRYVDTTEPIEVPSVEEALAQLREANDTAAKEPPETDRNDHCAHQAPAGALLVTQPRLAPAPSQWSLGYGSTRLDTGVPLVDLGETPDDYLERKPNGIVADGRRPPNVSYSRVAATGAGLLR